MQHWPLPAAQLIPRQDRLSGAIAALALTLETKVFLLELLSVLQEILISDTVTLINC